MVYHRRSDGTRERGIEDFVPESQYRSGEHRGKVVEHIRDNLNILDFTLTEEEMAKIASLNKGKRYYIRTDAALKGFASWQPSYETV